MNNIKNRVKEKIKEYSNDEYLEGYIKNEFLTDDGSADIILKINSKNDLFDSNTYGNQIDLDKKIYSFIDNKSSMLNNNIKLSLCIIENDLNKEDLEKIKHLINEHYAIELYKIQKTYRRYKNRIISLILSGIFFLICYILIYFYISSNFLIEIFGFLFSFTLWEAFSTLIDTLSNLRIERESITQKLLIDIYFKKQQEN